MKTIYILVFLIFLSAFLNAQTVPQPINKKASADTIVPGKGKREKQLKRINDRKIEKHSDTESNEPKKSALIDTTKQNKYGDLLDDDTAYNKKYPIWRPALETFGAVAFTWSVDRFVLNADYARIGPSTWKYNIQKGWEWDRDKFGVNFIGHPYSGTLSFNAARANGFNYLQSGAFAVAGSLMWEYFGENTRPSYNDIINTPINGAFLGEILYRLSSNILDDRTRGLERISREVLAGIIDPVRGVNRLILGQTSRITNKEVYQKEPLNVSLYAGLHKVNNETNNAFLSGTNSFMANVQFDYGNPFEKRSRKPFDFFKLRAEFDYGVGKKILDNVTGYGILVGKNASFGKTSLLYGLFQYYDYWDNKIFELGTIGFGGGIFSKVSLNKASELYTNIHIALVPFAGNSTHLGPDTSKVRDYNFGEGLEGKFETTINIGRHATASIIYYSYLINTYVGLSGYNLINILKPRVTVRIYKGMSLGFEHYIYITDRYLDDYPIIHAMRTEQKIFLLIYFEDDQRRGRYN